MSFWWNFRHWLFRNLWFGCSQWQKYLHFGESFVNDCTRRCHLANFRHSKSQNVIKMTIFPFQFVSETIIMDYHYCDAIMGTIASEITSLTIVYTTVYSDADQNKHQSSASLAFVWGIHRDRWIPRTKGQLRGKCFHLMTSSWLCWSCFSCFSKDIANLTCLQGSTLMMVEIMPVICLQYFFWMRNKLVGDTWAVIIMVQTSPHMRRIYRSTVFGGSCRYISYITQWPLGDSKSTPFKFNIQNSGLGARCELALVWMPQTFTDV